MIVGRHAHRAIRNERTSLKMTQIAAKVLAVEDIHHETMLWVIDGSLEPGRPRELAMGNVQTLAASHLSQVPNRPKRKAVRPRA